MILVTNRSWLPSSGIVLVLLLPPSWASHGPPQAKGCVQHACGQAKYRTRRARGVRSAVFASWAFPPNRGQRRQALSALARAVVKHRGVALALGSPADGAAKQLGLHAPVLSRLGGEGAGAPHQTNMPTISSYSEHSFVAIVLFVRRGRTIIPSRMRTLVLLDAAAERPRLHRDRPSPPCDMCVNVWLGPICSRLCGAVRISLLGRLLGMSMRRSCLRAAGLGGVIPVRRCSLAWSGFRFGDRLCAGCLQTDVVCLFAVLTCAVMQCAPRYSCLDCRLCCADFPRKCVLVDMPAPTSLEGGR